MALPGGSGLREVFVLALPGGSRAREVFVLALPAGCETLQRSFDRLAALHLPMRPAHDPNTARPAPLPRPQRPSTRSPLALTLALVGACSRADPEPAPTRETPSAHIDEPPPYPALDPASITPLQVLYFPDPIGEGYARVPIEMGEPMHTGKWLGLANRGARFMGPKHVIVNHFRSRPKHLEKGDLIKNVLLNVETGEAVAEFEYGRYVQWFHGLAIVFQAGDERPYLLDAESEELVLAVPAGAHDYVLDENYWLRFSPIAKRVWVYARDRENTIHLYEWEDRSAPPELPQNPFPFMPKFWDPLHSTGLSSADHEEVQPQDRNWNDCPRAILIPPKGYECLDDEDLDETLPLTDGWRVDNANDWIFNRRDGRGVDLSGLCPDEHPLFAHILHRAPAEVRLTCQGDPAVWMLWTPPDRVQRLDPEYAVKLNAAELIDYFHRDVGQLELKVPSLDGVHTRFDSSTLIRELIGEDYNCPDLSFRSGSEILSGMVCKHDDGLVQWFELIDKLHKRRSRFQATELVVGQGDMAVAVIRSGGRDRVVRLSLASR